VTFPSIPRRLAALAAMSALALALSAAPALAGSQANGHSGWFVYGGGPQPVTGLQETCGDSLYTVVSGTIDSVWQMKGSIDPNTGLAIDNGHGIETWTANNVVVADQNGDTHRVVFSRRLEGTWHAGADVAGDPGGPYTSFSWIEHLQIAGTSDGYSLVMNLHHTVFSGTCAQLPN